MAGRQLHWAFQSPKPTGAWGFGLRHASPFGLKAAAPSFQFKASQQPGEAPRWHRRNDAAGWKHVKSSWSWSEQLSLQRLADSVLLQGLARTWEHTINDRDMTRIILAWVPLSSPGGGLAFAHTPHVHDKRRAYRHSCRGHKSKSWLKARCFVDAFNAKCAEPKGQAAHPRQAANFTPLGPVSHGKNLVAVRYADAPCCTRQADPRVQQQPAQTSRFSISRRCRASFFRKSSLRAAFAET